MADPSETRTSFVIAPILVVIDNAYDLNYGDPPEIFDHSRPASTDIFFATKFYYLVSFFP